MKSLRSGSSFEGSRLSIQRHVQFLWKWAQKDFLRAVFFEGMRRVKFSSKWLETENVFGSDNENLPNATKTEKTHT